MPSINLNEFWSQVREDSRTRMDPNLWKSTIYWLLPVALDEAHNNMVLMTMQSFIREIIQNEPSISATLTQSLNTIWKQVNPHNMQPLSFTIKTVQELNTQTEESSQPAETITVQTTQEPAAPVNTVPPAQPMNRDYNTAPASPMDYGYEGAEHDTMPTPHVPVNPDITMNDYGTNNHSTDDYAGSFESVRQKLGYDSNNYGNGSNSVRTIKPKYDDPVYIDTEASSRRRHKMPDIPQDSLFMDEDNSVTTSNSVPAAPVVSRETQTLKKESSLAGQKKNLTKQEETILAASILDPKYTFDNFITTGTNVLPKALAQEVAKSPGEHNPFYIYGQSGMGKTHLMHAIGHQILENNPAARIMCVPAQKYIEYYLDSLNKNRDVPKDIFHNIDVLLLDDVQAFETKDGTRQDFFHTFNDLIQMNKQIILTSDVLPEDLEHTEVRLKTRFAAGLVVTIDPPSPEVLEAILLSNLDNERAKNPDLHVDNGVIRLLSQAFSRNSIRKLEGAFNKLITVAEIQNESDNITVEYALKVLDNLLPDTEKPALSITYIQDFIASFFHIKKELLVGQKRNKQYAHPRQIAMYLCRELLDESYPQISLSFGKKDHTTALHAYTKIANDIKKDDEMKRLIDEITSKIQENT